MLSRLFIAALWSPAGKGLTSWLLFVMFNCVSVTFPSCILGQVWYLIVLIPDLCHLSYFVKKQTLPFFNQNMKLCNLVLIIAYSNSAMALDIVKIDIFYFVSCLAPRDAPTHFNMRVFYRT